MAGPDRRLSSLTPVDNGKHNIEKSRAHASGPVVKQEPQQEVEEKCEQVDLAHGEGSGAVAAKALVAGSMQQIDVRVDKTLLHCQACLLPLKLLVFKCESGHVVCLYCRNGHDKVCFHAAIHCSGMDAFVCAIKVPCSYRGFGCDSYVVYHEADKHMRECHCAPCMCPEHGCGFLGSPRALINHFSTGHSRPIIVIHYSCPGKLFLPLSQRWHVVVGQEDRSVFLVTLGELGGATTVLSLVCVRADGTADAAPQFWCKLSVDHPRGEKDKVVVMTSTVTSSAMFGGTPMPRQGVFLAVPSEFISGKMITISIRIDQVHSVDAATMSKTMPQATTT